MNARQKRTQTTRRLVLAGLLGGISIFMAITQIGYITIPGWFTRATFMHVPLIIGVIVEGLAVGLPTALIFGVSSLILAVTQPTGLLSFCFVNPLVSVLPRLLVAVVVWLVWQAMTRGKKLSKTRRSLAVILSTCAGSAANTVLVLLAIALIYGNPVAEAMGTSAAALPAVFGSIALANGLPEMLVAAVITFPVVMGLWKAFPLLDKTAKTHSKGGGGE